LILLLLGIALLVPLSFGPISIGPMQMSLNTMLLAMTLATLGLSMLCFGGIASIMFDYSGQLRLQLERALPYNETLFGCLLVGAVGAGATVPLIFTYIENDFVLPEIGIDTHHAVLGLWLIILSFQTFIFSLMVRTLGVVLPPRPLSNAKPETEA
jgi:hypothetical protein